jgi:hypothetical protein
MLTLSAVTEANKLFPSVPVLPYGTNQNVPCIRQHSLPHEERERGSTAFSCVEKKKGFDLVRIPNATTAQRYEDSSL